MLSLIFDRSKKETSRSLKHWSRRFLQGTSILKSLHGIKLRMYECLSVSYTEVFTTAVPEPMNLHSPLASP